MDVLSTFVNMCYILTNKNCELSDNVPSLVQITQEHENKRLVNKSMRPLHGLCLITFLQFFKLLYHIICFFAYFTLQHNKVDCFHLGLCIGIFNFSTLLLY